MWHPHRGLVVAMAVLLGGCGAGTAVVEAPSTTDSPSSTVMSSTTSVVDDLPDQSTATDPSTTILAVEPRQVAGVPPLGSDDAEQRPWLVDLHGAVGFLIADMNALGMAAASLDEYEEGWEDQEPFGVTLLAIDSDLTQIKESITAVMEANGAVLSGNCRWVLAGSDSEEISEVLIPLTTMWAIPCPLQVMAVGDLFSQRSRQDVVDYWNGEEGPPHIVEQLSSAFTEIMNAI